VIVFDLSCSAGHRFEGWFADAAAFEAQRAGELVGCPMCGSTEVERAISVPRIGSGKSDGEERGVALAKLARMQATMLKNSSWVGGQFAVRARAMAEGSEPVATIHGRATVGEAKALHDDGIAVLPLPFPVVPPERLN